MYSEIFAHAPRPCDTHFYSWGVGESQGQASTTKWHEKCTRGERTAWRSLESGGGGGGSEKKLRYKYLLTWCLIKIDSR